MAGVFGVCAVSRLATSVSEPWRCASRLTETDPTQRIVKGSVHDNIWKCSNYQLILVQMKG